MQSITQTNLTLKGQTGFYRGKVRDVYVINELLISVTTDRISAFDVVLTKPIPGKGAVLNLLAAHFLKAAAQVCPVWLTDVPDANVSVGHKAQPFPVEMVVRGHLVGHAARIYKAGKREICGVLLPEGLQENDPLPDPIITPTTKAHQGHDEDISREQIIQERLIDESTYTKLEKYSLELFALGQKMANDRGLILADTKYEFGLYDNDILLIDEVHTPDSSRYFYSEGFEERQKKPTASKTVI